VQQAAKEQRVCNKGQDEYGGAALVNSIEDAAADLVPEDDKDQHKLKQREQVDKGTVINAMAGKNKAGYIAYK
jgi:hypothetical protein